jgi:hypothetical protein
VEAGQRATCGVEDGAGVGASCDQLEQRLHLRFADPASQSGEPAHLADLVLDDIAEAEPVRVEGAGVLFGQQFRWCILQLHGLQEGER